MKKITVHWTGGGPKPNSTDKQHYHYLVSQDKAIHSGVFKPQANIPGPRGLINGTYAAHCGGGNSNNIGVALCGMRGYTGPAHVGDYPIRRQQCEAAWELVANLCMQYGIAVTPETVMTHAEFGLKHPDTESAGKVDITWLPHEPELKTPEAVGSYIRGKVQWYINQKTRSDKPAKAKK
ncbi:MAG TPA: N-acetylmuramoyl-L-alanine amidase [Prosthecobacter sp.]|nr:N-acetylmuramoyl-L-alanine amidase [Prosthecobacter sp.]